LGFHFIPNAVKVFLDVELKEAAKRIFKEGRKNESNNDIEDTVKKIKIRIDSENKRYKEYYGVDYHDMGNYDIVIDTTGIKPDEIVKDIIKIIDEKFK
jgi:cytidylate kinase